MAFPAVAAGRLRGVLPRGVRLDPVTWSTRHGWVVRLLWGHVVGLPIVAVAVGEPLRHAIEELLVVGLFAVVAGLRPLQRSHRALAATLGLTASSAILVHLTGGLIESHFHFFVVVAVISLYQSWRPFLASLLFVVLHHGIMGAVAPASVFNHDPATASPWVWASVHGGFILAQSIACLVMWRHNETALDRERDARERSDRANRGLDAAQALSRIGSWQWDPQAKDFWWSTQLYHLLGLDPSGADPSFRTLIAHAAPDDRQALWEMMCSGEMLRSRVEHEYTLLPREGPPLTVVTIGQPVVDADGRLIVVGTVQDVTERRAAERRTAHAALHDPLTGLGNRTMLEQQVAHVLDAPEPSQARLALLYLDLDDFKTVNDSLGHGVGDDLLIEVADRLIAAAAPGDWLVRLGGDEFALLMPAATVPDAERAAERIHESLHRPIELHGHTWAPTACIGIATACAGGSVDDLLREGDLAMYAAKRDGKGRHRVFTPDLLASAVARMALKAELRTALDDQQFVLHYQPIVDLASGEVVGLEALVRWHHPTRGLVPPLDFLPLMEETGLIVGLGCWILEEATKSVRLLEEAAGRPLTVNVNVSRVQLSADIQQTVMQALAESGLDAGRLVLEITESTVMSPDPIIVEQLQRLRSRGVRIAVDDFGTGYSSLGLLQSLPIDILKIDKAFVDGVASGGESAALADAVIQLASILDLSPVAEGVETTEQAAALLSRGCTIAQGYLFGRPRPLEDVRVALCIEPTTVR